MKAQLIVAIGVFGAMAASPSPEQSEKKEAEAMAAFDHGLMATPPLSFHDDLNSISQINRRRPAGLYRSVTCSTGLAFEAEHPASMGPYAQNPATFAATGNSTGSAVGTAGGVVGTGTAAVANCTASDAAPPSPTNLVPPNEVVASEVGATSPCPGPIQPTSTPASEALEVGFGGGSSTSATVSAPPGPFKCPPGVSQVAPTSSCHPDGSSTAASSSPSQSLITVVVQPIDAGPAPATPLTSSTHHHSGTQPQSEETETGSAQPSLGSCVIYVEFSIAVLAIGLMSGWIMV